MNRRGFLKGLAALTAAPFLPKVLPLPDSAVPPSLFSLPDLRGKFIRSGPILEKFPQFLVYINGVLQAEGLNAQYQVVKDGVGRYAVTFSEPLSSTEEVTVVAMPSKDSLVWVSDLKTTGVIINERHLHDST